jgi:RNA polymerase sigma-70 factor (ECF subfamily)
MAVPLQPDLMAQVQKGDKASFEALFRTYYEMLCNFSRKFVGDMDEAEELVQDLFAQLWEKREQLKVETSPQSYLFSAARNRCLNHLKHRKVRDQHAQSVLAAPLQSEPDATQALEAAELQSRIQAAIDLLPARCREVFVLSRFQGKKYQEIATQMGISPRTVEVQIGKALKILREALRDYLPLSLLWLILEVWK